MMHKVYMKDRSVITAQKVEITANYVITDNEVAIPRKRVIAVESV